MRTMMKTDVLYVDWTTEPGLEALEIMLSLKAGTCEDMAVDDEIREAEKIFNAFLSYALFGREMTCRTMMSFK